MPPDPTFTIGSYTLGYTPMTYATTYTVNPIIPKLNQEQIAFFNERQLARAVVRCRNNSLHALPYARKDGLYCKECNRVLYSAKSVMDAGLVSAP